MTTNRSHDTLAWDVCETPIGPLTVAGTARGLAAISFPGRGAARAEEARDRAAVAGTTARLEAYFAGEATSFDDLILDLSLSPFEKGVHDALMNIPYGATVSYSELAREVGRPDIVRGVAAAVGRNPVAIAVPCHRVIGADGSLTGYGGGLRRKQALLELERSVAAGLAPDRACGFRQLAML